MVDFNDTMFKENVPNVRVEEYYHVKSPVQNKRKIKKYKYLLMEWKVMSSIKDCFSLNKSLIKQGTIPTAFCKPVFYSTKTFKSKSEQEWYNRIAGQVLNLRHLLVNDSDNSYNYLMKFLR